MSSDVVQVSNATELQSAIDQGAAHIVVTGEISGMPMITLAEGQRLSGGTLRFGASRRRQPSQVGRTASRAVRF
jgi:hypothetical protein